MNSGAERFNGLMAMLGIVAGIGAYATTGQFIPGIFQIFMLKKQLIDYLYLLLFCIPVRNLIKKGYQLGSASFELPKAGAFIPSQSYPTMIPTIANKTINAIPTTGAVGAGVDNNPPSIK